MTKQFAATKPIKTNLRLGRSRSERASKKLLKPLAAAGLGLLILQLSGCNSLPINNKETYDQYKQKQQPLVTKQPEPKSTETKPLPAEPLVKKRKILHLGSKPEIKKEIEAQYEAQAKIQPPSNNLWDHFKGHFKLVESNQGHFDNSISYYKKRQKHIISVSSRAKPYLYYIVQEVKKRDMPLEIALLPMVESGFQAHAQSHRKALGLWQFMPGTAKMLGLDRNWWYDGRRDVVQSTQAALTYLQQHYENTHDWLLSLACYNAGYGNVLKAIKRYERRHGKSEQLPTFWQISKYLPRETQNYVPALLSLAYLVEHNDKYQIALEPIENKPFFNVVELNKQVSLYAVASNTQTPRNLLAMLNPGYIRKATPPKGPYHLLLPTEKHDAFNTTYQNNAQLFRVNWKKHRVRPGDYLGKIANRYGTSVSAIRKMNSMRSNFIRAGQILLIPVVAQNTQVVRNTRVAQRTSTKMISSSNRYLYQVKRGDTLSEIAQQFDVSTRQLMQWNGLSKSSTLKVGQKLSLAKDKIQNQKVIYTVNAGESLSQIALEHGVKVKQLMSWNRIKSARSIQPGDTLTIWQGPKTSKHAKYTVKTGDSLWNIAKAFKLSVKSLAKYNSLSLKSMLQPGQIIKIPFSS